MIDKHRDERQEIPRMGKQFTTDSPSIAEIRQAKKPMEKTVDIFMDPNVAARAWDLAVQMNALKQAPNKTGKGLAEKANAQKVEELQAEIDAVIASAEVVTFHFRGIGRKRYEDLIRANPPTDEEKKEWREGGNQGTPLSNAFYAALVAATCVEPEMSFDDAQALLDEWSQNDVETLVTAAVAVCREHVSIPFSRNDSEKIAPTA
jgi:hypothetical protein